MSFMTRRSGRVRFGETKRQAGSERDQPRPALGLRPWFALERRARSLRRFAFAIVSGSVPGDGRYRSGGSLVLSDGTWTSPPLILAVSFTDRLRGIQRAGAGGVLIRAASVRGAGTPLRIVHLAGDGTVVGDEILPGRGRRRARGAWIVEIRGDLDPPDPGTRLVPLLSPML